MHHQNFNFNFCIFPQSYSTFLIVTLLKNYYNVHITYYNTFYIIIASPIFPTFSSASLWGLCLSLNSFVGQKNS